MPTANGLSLTDSKAKSSIRERLIKGIGAQGFSQAVQIFIRLAEVPLLLSFWGTQLYGEWLMLSSIPIYMSMADGGFVGAACREMTMRRAAGDQKGTVAIFQSTWLLLITISLIVGIICFVLVEVLPLAEWLSFGKIPPPETKFIMILLVAYVLVGFQAGLLNGGFWVVGRYSRGMYHIALTQAIEFGGLTTVVLMGCGPVEVAKVYLLARLLGTGLMWKGQRRSSKWLKHGITHVSIAEIRRIASPAFASLAFPIGNILNIQGIRLTIGLLLGPPAVALFVPLRTFSRLAMQPASIINHIIEPELAIAHGAGNRSLFQNVFIRSCQYTLWACLCACCLAGISASWIFPAWTGGKVIIHWPTYFLLLSGVLVNSIWYTALMVPYAINHHKCIAWYYAIIYGIAAIGLGCLGAAWFRLSGVATALLIAESAMAIVVMREALRVAKVDVREWSRTVINPPLPMVKKVFDINNWKNIYSS